MATQTAWAVSFGLSLTYLFIYFASLLFFALRKNGLKKTKLEISTYVCMIGFLILLLEQCLYAGAKTFGQESLPKYPLFKIFDWGAHYLANLVIIYFVLDLEAVVTILVK